MKEVEVGHVWSRDDSKFLSLKQENNDISMHEVHYE